MATKPRVTWRWCQVSAVFYGPLTPASSNQAGLMADTSKDHLYGSRGNTLQVISGMKVHTQTPGSGMSDLGREPLVHTFHALCI